MALCSNLSAELIKTLLGDVIGKLHQLCSNLSAELIKTDALVVESLAYGLCSNLSAELIKTARLQDHQFGDESSARIFLQS